MARNTVITQTLAMARNIAMARTIARAGIGVPAWNRTAP
jgi:hypothetical protein